MPDFLPYAILLVIMSPYVVIIISATRDTWATSHWLTVRNWMIAIVGIGGGLFVIDHMTANAFLGLLFTGGVLGLLFLAHALGLGGPK